MHRPRTTTVPWPASSGSSAPRRSCMCSQDPPCRRVSWTTSPVPWRVGKCCSPAVSRMGQTPCSPCRTCASCRTGSPNPQRRPIWRPCWHAAGMPGTQTATSSTARSPAGACSACPSTNRLRTSRPRPPVPSGRFCSNSWSRALPFHCAWAGRHWWAGNSPSCCAGPSRQRRKAQPCRRRPSSGRWYTRASWSRWWSVSPPITKNARLYPHLAAHTFRACRTPREPHSMMRSTGPCRT
mmetsp:Transcript_82649/g.252591  ORF Transcript_82649/g.252591 Transcript_82649/m.252591 type:complete len:238 (+) Transcript_82649:277-990(+)